MSALGSVLEAVLARPGGVLLALALLITLPSIAVGGLWLIQMAHQAETDTAIRGQLAATLDRIAQAAGDQSAMMRLAAVLEAIEKRNAARDAELATLRRRFDCPPAPAAPFRHGPAPGPH